MNSTHLYWEFVQSHKAASIRGPNEDKRSLITSDSDWEEFPVTGDNLDNILDFYLPYLERMQVDEKKFVDALEVSAAQWLKEELRRDAYVKEESKRMSDNIISTSGSRLVRDYLWIEQQYHGLRDYC